MIKRNYFLIIGLICSIFSSCDGIFEDIYDKPTNKYEIGFNNVDSLYNTGTIYIDASDYMNWIYIDLHNKVVDTVYIDTTCVAPVPNEPQNWDIGIHRYDVKTNKGMALETKSSDIISSAFITTLPKGEFVKDNENDSVTVDMSRMVEGIIKKVPSDVNRTISSWLSLDLSTMPPIYKLSNKVYIVKMKDDTYAALQLKNYMSPAGTKGYMTIDYVYPLNIINDSK